jgi:tetratricopeptide (TPR) repeat protein
MKATHLLSLLVLITPLAAQSSKPAADKSTEQDVQELLPNQEAFLNLPEETRKEFFKNLGEANRLFQEKRIFETLDVLDKATRIFADSPEILNLRGSCYVEMRAFDKALADFTEALSLSKDNASIEFNIAEVYFVTKEWQKCCDIFERILPNIPEKQTALARLVEFKILLCKNKLNQKEEVKKLVDKYDFLDDSPYYYYAQAAVAYDNKNLIKAEEWLARAGRIFIDPNVLAPWQDTMVEYGYIKSFYGEADGVEE